MASLDATRQHSSVTISSICHWTFLWPNLGMNRCNLTRLIIEVHFISGLQKLARFGELASGSQWPWNSASSGFSIKWNDRCFWNGLFRGFIWVQRHVPGLVWANSRYLNSNISQCRVTTVWFTRLRFYIGCGIWWNVHFSKLSGQLSGKHPMQVAPQDSAWNEHPADVR